MDAMGAWAKDPTAAAASTSKARRRARSGRFADVGNLLELSAA